MLKLVWVVVVGAAACTVQPAPQCPTPTPPASCKPKAFRTDLTWYGNNRADLTAFIATKGCTSAGYDPAHQPVATFDWDNTVAKNDFGDAFTMYLVTHDKILQPPNHDWKQTSGYMTDAGAAALTAACGTTIAPGKPLPTSTNTACGAEILSMYDDNKTTAGAVAFTGQNPRWVEPEYAWTAQLAAGYTHDEVRAMAKDAITPLLAAPESATQTIAGRTGIDAWLRIYDQSKDLIAVLQSYGYDVWIVTASPQDVIATFAPMAGVPADHVVGIRSKTDAAGKLTYKFEGCGLAPDDTQSMIPYMQGKRCWINKAIFGDTTATAMQKRADGQRQVFAGGDSDSDTEFLRDATYRLVLNRNKTELMCHAYYNSLGTWRINPMFIQPKPALATPYTCSTKCVNGLDTPCTDDANNVIPNQTDSVH